MSTSRLILLITIIFFSSCAINKPLNIEHRFIPYEVKELAKLEFENGTKGTALIVNENYTYEYLLSDTCQLLTIKRNYVNYKKIIGCTLFALCYLYVL